MNEEEKKAIEKLEIEGTENNYLEVRIVLNLIDKQDKVIDLMAQDLTTDYHSKEWIIQHYIEEINK